MRLIIVVAVVFFCAMAALEAQRISITQSHKIVAVLAKTPGKR